MAQIAAERKVFVPALPTLWPRMLLGVGAHGISFGSDAPLPGRAPLHFPFSAPGVRYFYFARNACWLTVKLLGLEGGEILVPAYHHGVEIDALIDAGAEMNFYRVGPRWDVDLDDVERRIGPRTKALYLTHYAGFPGPAAQMRRLADKHGLHLIEDCALSLLSMDGGKPLGSTGDVGIFCIYKTLPVPNGGALVVNNGMSYDFPKTAAPPFSSTLSHVASLSLQNLEMRGGSVGRRVRSRIRGLGRRTVEVASIERVTTGSDDFDREHVNLGISSLTMRVIRAQNISRIVKTRRRNYLYLLEKLGGVSQPLFGELPPGVCPLFYPMVVQDKEPIMARLEARGIETIDFWRHFHPACDPSEFPDVAWLRDHILEIPCHQDLTPRVLDIVAQAVKDAAIIVR